MSSLTVVIPATDARATLERVVAAVRRAAESPEELIVVEQPRMLGPAAARNLGSRRASGDIIVFVDADVEVHEDAFARIRSAFAGDADLAAVFGSYDDDPGDGGIVSDFRNLLHHHIHHCGSGLATTFWAGLGAIPSTRAKLLQRFGTFKQPNHLETVNDGGDAGPYDVPGPGGKADKRRAYIAVKSHRPTETQRGSNGSRRNLRARRRLRQLKCR